MMTLFMSARFWQKRILVMVRPNGFSYHPCFTTAPRAGTSGDTLACDGPLLLACSRSVAVVVAVQLHVSSRVLSLVNGRGLFCCRCRLTAAFVRLSTLNALVLAH